MCKYNLAWIGDCKEPEVENGMCEKHKDLKCCSCGKPATHECAETGQFVCGAELCDDCEHTICDNGTNGGIGFFREGKRPEGLKEHCKKSEQVYKPWYVTETEKIDEKRASEEAMRELKPVVDLSEYTPFIGSRVIKHKSNKPFKSGLSINTVKGVIVHPILNIPAYTFEEDESYVECRRCKPIAGNQELADKIAAIQKIRDEQQEQTDLDLKGLTAVERIQLALPIVKIDGILKGLDIALEILNKPY